MDIRATTEARRVIAEVRSQRDNHQECVQLLQERIRDLEYNLSIVQTQAQEADTSRRSAESTNHYFVGAIEALHEVNRDLTQTLRHAVTIMMLEEQICAS